MKCTNKQKENKISFDKIGLPQNFSKILSELMCEPLSLIHNQCIKWKIFQRCLKTAKMITEHKNGM